MAGVKNICCLSTDVVERRLSTGFLTISWVHGSISLREEQCFNYLGRQPVGSNKLPAAVIVAVRARNKYRRSGAFDHFFAKVPHPKDVDYQFSQWTFRVSVQHSFRDSLEERSSAREPREETSGRSPKSPRLPFTAIWILIPHFFYSTADICASNQLTLVNFPQILPCQTLIFIRRLSENWPSFKRPLQRHQGLLIWSCLKVT